MREDIRLLITGLTEDLRQGIHEALEAAGMSPESARSPSNAEGLKQRLSERPYDILMVEDSLVLRPEFMAMVRRTSPDTAVVALAAADDAPDSAQAMQRSMAAMRAGADCYLWPGEMERMPAMLACCRRMSRLLAERRGYRQGMAEFQARFDNLFRHSPDGVVILDDRHRVMEANRSFLRLFGYTEDEALGESLGDLIVPADLRDEFEAHAERVARGGMVRSDTVRRRKDGAPVHVALLGCPIMLSEDMIGGFAIYTDITARIRALEALRRAESKYRSIFENAVEGMYISTPFGRFVTVNRAMSDLLGYDSPSDLTDNVKSIRREIYADPGMRDEFRRRIERTGTVSGYVSSVVRKDGGVVEVMENVRAVHDDDGELLYFQGTMQPVPRVEKRTERDAALSSG